MIKLSLKAVLFSAVLSKLESRSIDRAPPQVKVGKSDVVGVWEEGTALFAGIPYAEAPIGVRRFAETEAKELATGQFNATDYGQVCMQLTTSGKVSGDEDCLTLNVVVPSTVLESGTKTSVIVWIHGGGLVDGSAAKYSLLDISRRGQVIGISLQYRLNVFGFLSLQDKNVGLSDQVLALQWIQKNIEAFGGNKDDVTIFGQSAGGSSVLFLAQASRTSPLFTRAIAQSPWTTGKSLGGVSIEEALETVWQDCYCTVLENRSACQTKDRIALLQLLQTANASQLVQACGDLVAVVDRPLLDSLCQRETDAFAPGVELLVGSNMDESHLFLLQTNKDTENDDLRSFDLEIRLYLSDTYIKTDLGIDWLASECTTKAVDFLIDHITEAYNNDAYALVDFQTDLFFSAITELSAAAPKSKNPSRRYLFEQPINAQNTTVPVGTCHCAELPYTLGFDGFDWDNDTPDDLKIIDYFEDPTPTMRKLHYKIQDLWIDFMKNASTKQNFIHTDGISLFGSPYSHISDGTISYVLTGAPVHTRQGQLLSHSLLCQRDHWRELLIANSTCSSPSSSLSSSVLSSSTQASIQ